MTGGNVMVWVRLCSAVIWGTSSKVPSEENSSLHIPVLLFPALPRCLCVSGAQCSGTSSVAVPGVSCSGGSR